MNPDKDMVMIVVALNLIKRKQYKKYEKCNSWKKRSIWTWLLRRPSPGINNILIEKLWIES